MTIWHSKNRVLGAAAVLLFSLSLSVTRPGQADADQVKSTYAEIVNTAMNPVPIEGTVEIAKLPPVDIAGGQVACAQSGNWTVQLDKGSQCGCGPQDINSSPDKPLYVRDVNARPRTPFSSAPFSRGPFGGSYNTHPEAPITWVPVPAGKRFVVEHVMATVAPRNAGAFGTNLASAYLVVDDASGGAPIQWLFLPLVNQGEVYPGRQLFVGNQPVNLVVPPGGSITLIGVQRGGEDHADYGIISGYFEDL